MAYDHLQGHEAPFCDMLKLQVAHCLEEMGNDRPGGAARSAGKAPVALSRPALICANSSRCDHAAGLLIDLVIKSAACCLVFTYFILTLG